jgi:hypothetical protein
MEHGHAVRAWSTAAAADLPGGAEAAVARRVARRRGGEAVRAAGAAARAATLLASGRGMCVSRGRADHQRRTRPAERRTATSITSVRDRVRELGRGVIEELGVRRRSWTCVAGGEGVWHVPPRNKMNSCDGVVKWTRMVHVESWRIKIRG